MGIRTGAEFLAGLRDGRTLYMDGERIDDVTRDPRLPAAPAPWPSCWICSTGPIS